MMKPTVKPANPCFSSGPCAKRPGWSLAKLEAAALGRSHRAKVGKAKLKEVIDRSRAILGIPAEYRIGIVPASDTGAVEMAMWSMLGPLGVDVLAWEAFGKGWAADCKKQLELRDLHVIEAPYGELPNLSQVDWNRDVVFTWNGTTSGVRVPNGEWIPSNRSGLSICDATSAAFAMDLPWDKLDVTTWSWQKVLGGEGAHGMIVLSPRAVERLQTYIPRRPLPKIFQLAKDGALIEGIFEGETINTPSMLCVEDAIDGLKWAESVGGLAGLVNRSESNLKLLASWVGATPWVDFLCRDEAARSCTSVTFTISDPWYLVQQPDVQSRVLKEFTALLDREKAAYDIGAYRDAPAGLRIWAGATVEAANLKALLPWLDWAWEEVKRSMAQAA